MPALDRVLETLEADTAAVLLTDESGRELVARAARGLEEEVRQGVRVPIGRGFAAFWTASVTAAFDSLTNRYMLPIAAASSSGGSNTQGALAG